MPSQKFLSARSYGHFAKLVATIFWLLFPLNFLYAATDFYISVNRLRSFREVPALQGGYSLRGDIESILLYSDGTEIITYTSEDEWLVYVDPPSSANYEIRLKRANAFKSIKGLYHTRTPLEYDTPWADNNPNRPYFTATLVAQDYSEKFWSYSAKPLLADLDLSGKVSWTIRGNRVTLNIEKIVNNGTGKSGNLRVRLLAMKSRYTGGKVSGKVMATLLLPKLKGSYQFSNISEKVGVKLPNTGRYFTTLILEEYYNENGYVVVDYMNFPGSTEFSPPMFGQLPLERKTTLSR